MRVFSCLQQGRPRLLHAAALAVATAALGAVSAVVGGASAVAAPGGTALLTAEQSAFLKATVPAGIASHRRYGVPASVVIAQAILETGWGTSDLARNANNFFGMTCGRAGAGPLATGCRPGPDSFCDASGCRRGTANFRVYRSMGDSFRDHGRQLSGTARYRTAYANRRNADRFVAEMHRAGYATDARYAGSIRKIMAKYDLYRYNRLTA